MSSIRFLHAADLHLDAPIQSTNLFNEQWIKRLKEATWDALDHFIQLAIKKEVDFVILAGDMIDKESGNRKTILRFKEKIRKLSNNNIHTYVVLGNHDLMYGSQFFRSFFEDDDKVYIFSDKRVEKIVHQKNGKKAVKIYGRGFWDADPYDNPTLPYLDEFDDEDDGMLTIAIAHGRVGEVNELLPCPSFPLNDLKKCNVHYWAMGHIHKRKVYIDELPLVVNPAGIQGVNIYELGPMGCYFSEWEGRQLKNIQFQSLEAIRWEKIIFCFDEKEEGDCFKSISQVEKSIYKQLHTVYRKINKPIIVQLILEGKTTLYGKLRNPHTLESIAKNVSDDYVLVAEIIDHTIPYIHFSKKSNLKIILEQFASMIDKLKKDASLYDRLEKEHRYLFSDPHFQKVTGTRPNERGRGQWKVKKIANDRRNWLEEAKKLGIDLLLQQGKNICLREILNELNEKQQNFFNKKTRNGTVNDLLRKYEKIDKQVFGLYGHIDEEKLEALQQEQHDIDGQLFQAVKQWTLYSIAIFAFNQLEKHVYK